MRPSNAHPSRCIPSQQSPYEATYIHRQEFLLFLAGNDMLRDSKVRTRRVPLQPPVLLPSLTLVCGHENRVIHQRAGFLGEAGRETCPLP